MRVNGQKPLVIEQPNMNYLWAAILVEELRRQGADHFFLSPGSRSAPLLSAAGYNKKIFSFVHFDERALAFMACGYCASSGKTAVIVCTSGTAAANFLPAVIEASKKKLPLIVLTADRPPELQKTGAAQSIDQNGLYGSFVRWSFDLPCPSREINPQFVLTTAAQLISRAKGGLRGPVHLNVMFREPLSPERTGGDLTDYILPLESWAGSEKPYTEYFTKESLLTDHSVTEAVARIKRIKNGVILAGKLATLADRDAVTAFSLKTGFPIFADITSGLRLCKPSVNVISYFDQILLNKKKLFDFDGVIHFGGRMTSRRCYDFLALAKLKEYLMIIGHPLRSDPLHKVTARFEASPAAFVRYVLPGIERRPASITLVSWQSDDQKTEKLIEKELSCESLSGPVVARIVSTLIQSGDGLFLSNSMPVRDMDMYASIRGGDVVVGANRGASGIDGIIASATGFSQGLKKTTTLIIGDLAFLCDLNALALLRSIEHKLIIVILNNNGGGIFAQLPVASDRNVRDKFFITPHGLSFSSVARMFDIHYVSPETTTKFRDSYIKALRRDKSTIIEINIPTRENAYSVNK